MVGNSVAKPELVEAKTFWWEPEPKPVWRVGSGSSSTLDKTDEIINDILFLRFHIDKRLFKKPNT